MFTLSLLGTSDVVSNACVGESSVGVYPFGVLIHGCCSDVNKKLLSCNQTGYSTKEW